MKYILITLMTVTGLIAQEQPEHFSFASSQFQAFYYITDVTIDGNALSSDDWVGAFNGDICVGAKLWDTSQCGGGICDVPAMGDDGSEFTDGYMLSGELPTFKIYDTSEGIYYDAVITGDITNPQGDIIDGTWDNMAFVWVANLQSNNLTVISGCTDPNACNYIDYANENDGSCEYVIDCADECGGSAVVDECGECNGDGIDEGFCDCAGNVDLGCGCAEVGPSGCDNACGSTAVVDECDVCGGDNSSCADCCGVANGDSTTCDGECGPCNDDIDEGACDCAGNVLDCALVCNGSSVVDNCGTCDSDDSNDCIQDCAGAWGGDAYVDACDNCGGTCSTSCDICGVCDGNGSSCAEPSWRIQLTAEIDSYDQFQFSGNADWLLRDDQNFLGVAGNATWGYDSHHDAPEPPTGPGNYIKLFFDHPEWNEWVTHYTEDIVKDDHDFFSTNLTEWKVRVQSDVPGTTVITFNEEDNGVEGDGFFDPIPENYQIYAECNSCTDVWTDLRADNTIDFYMDGSGQKEFSIYIGNIPPQAPDNLSSEGHYSSITLDWDEDGDGLNDIGNRYQATSYNVYRDDSPGDPDSNDGIHNNDTPGGCFECDASCPAGGGLLSQWQLNSDYNDDVDLYSDWPGEGLLQESTYDYTVTGSNDAGESSDGHTVRTSGGDDTFYEGRDSRTEATTGLNLDPTSEPSHMASTNGTNIDSGVYEIPHNNDPDENRISIHIGSWASDDPDFPNDMTQLTNPSYHFYFDYYWSLVSGPDSDQHTYGDLEDVYGVDTPELSFTAGNVHENGDKVYVWNLLTTSKHPVKNTGECGEWTTGSPGDDSFDSFHAHFDNEDITIVVHEEPNADPTPPDAFQLIRGEDGNSVTTMDNYDDSDYNDYDDALAVWFEPHNNDADNNTADLWFTAYDSDDDDGMCEGDGPPTCVIDCPGFENLDDTATEESVCGWIAEIVAEDTCLDDCDSNMWSEINEALDCCDNENCSIMGCPEGYVEDCAGDGDCAPEDWIGDGTCDGEDEPFGVDLTCYGNDDGDCSGGNCPQGYVDDCYDDDCCPESWVGDGFADCEDQAYGCDLTCHDEDGGDCYEEPEAACGDGSCDYNAGETADNCAPDCASSDACSDCEFDFSNYGSECCDTAWDDFAINCATLESNYAWDCSGCACPGDSGDGATQSCADMGMWDCGDGECIPSNYVCDGSSEFCNASWGADCDNGADEGLESCGYADECGDGGDEGCSDGSVEDCSGDGDCAPGSWVGDGWCDGTDEPYGYDLTCYENDGGDCDGRSADSAKILKYSSEMAKVLARKEMSPIFSSDSEKERYGEVLTSRSAENFCDELSYEYSIVNASLAGFDYVDENENDQFDLGIDLFTLNGSEVIFETADLGDYVPETEEQDLGFCDDCIPGHYSSGDPITTTGQFGHNGMDLHIKQNDNIYILTLTVTDIYDDSDNVSLLYIVENERNDGPTVGDLREQLLYYISYDKDTRQTQVGGCEADNLTAADSDNDDLDFEWDYVYDAAGTSAPDGDGELAYNDGNDDSHYAHAYGELAGLGENGWNDIGYDLEEGDHTFTFTATDPYSATANSATTIKVRREPDAVAASVDVIHTDLKYVTLEVSDHSLDAFASDECYGDVYDGDLDNTRTITLYNDGNLIETFRQSQGGDWLADDNSAGESTFVHIDKELEAETTYNYTVQSYNDDNQVGAFYDDISSESTTTGNRPTVEVVTPNGAEIGSITELYDVDFVTTDPQYISHIEVFYLRDGATEEDGTDQSGAKVESNTGVNVAGLASGDETNSFQISDDTGEEINYNAKVRVRVHDVGNYDGGNKQDNDDTSDFPFTMAAHTITKAYSAGWHLIGPPLTPYNSVLVDNFDESFGTWGAEWVAYDVSGAYDGLSLNLGEGYYVALAEDDTLIQSGDPVIGDPNCEAAQQGGVCGDDSFALANLDLDKGWNLIANPLVNKVSKSTFTVNDGNDDLLFEDAVDAGWIAPTIYGWFENAYSAVDRLLPFDGYFVNTSRPLTLKIRPHLYDDGELTRKAEEVVATSTLNLKAQDVSGEGMSDLITVGLSENADNEFVYGEDEYDLPRQAYTSMGDEYIDMKIGTDLMKDIRSTEYEDFQAWNISIVTEKVDNDIELSWGDVSGFDDDLHIVINGEAIDMHEEASIEFSTVIDEIAIVVGNVDSYLNPIPNEFGLSAAYPNPFNPTTTLGLALNEDSMVSMSVYNIRGQVVEVLVDHNMKAGYHNVVWNADGISSGMYFVRVETGANTAIQKLMLLK